MAAKKAAGKKKTAEKRGRPSKLDDLDREQVSKLALKGWTDSEMADFFEVTEQTWNNWKKKDPAFFESLKDWKAEFDERIERSLAERALGYSHPEDKIFNNNGRKLVVPTIKHYPPDTTACIFWLKNRQPDEWRDKHDHEVTGKNGGPLRMISTEMTPQEAAQAYADTLHDK
jgi:hypothetical protein